MKTYVHVCPVCGKPCKTSVPHDPDLQVMHLKCAAKRREKVAKAKRP